jgi:GNAT superfamily N-acetyltransferase
MDRVKCDIRAAAQADRSLLTLLAEETLHRLADGSGHPERFHPSELQDLLNRADVWVAHVGAEPVGFVAVEDEDDDLAVRCVCVHPAYEARGVANQLLDWVEGVALDRRHRRLTAFVPAADKLSLHLYRKHEFVVRPAEDAEMVELEKRLPEAGD